MTRIIFCADPLRPRHPDPLYAAEYEAARATGFVVELIQYEALVEDHDANRAIHSILSTGRREMGIYRGWMLTPEDYQRLYDALAETGIDLINTLAMYRHCHYLPEWYPSIQAHTPQTVWLVTGPDVEMEAAYQSLAIFGDRPVILKDFVKSRKHEWFEACYIPAAADRAAVERVVRRFLALQGPDLAGGLVFREYVPLEPLGMHPRSGMPLAKEYRLFWRKVRCHLGGQRIFACAYWDADITDPLPPAELFADVARQVQSRFFTMDVAQQLGGEWIIVELGDAQVSGLPENADVTAFYRALK
jgi:hypothetical protein